MLRSSVIVTLISIVSYLVSFANQVIIAKLFGASSNLDVYLVAISLPVLLMTIASSVFSMALVPVLVQKKHRSGYVQFSGLLFIVVSIVAIALSGIAYGLSPLIIHMMVPAYSETLALEAIAMMRFSWLVCGSSVIVSYFVGLHNATKRFFVAAWVSILPYLGMIVFSLLLADQIGTKTLVWGMLAGNLAAIPLLWIGIRGEFRVDSSCLSLWPEIMIVFRRMRLVFLSMLGLSIYATIDAIWATRLGANNLSYLAYSQRIMFTLGNAIVLGPMTVILPYLSEDVALGRHKEFRAQTLRAVRILLVFLSMAGLVCSMLAVPLVRLLFERGAFNRATTLQVGALIPGMFIGVLAMVCTVLIYRAYYAKGDIAGTALIGTVGAVLYFSLSGLLSNIGGLQGIIAAYAVTWWILLVWAVARLWRGHLRELWNPDNLKYIWQLALALGVCGGLVWTYNELFVQPSLEKGIVSLGTELFLAVGLGTISFHVITGWVFKMQEVTLLFGLVAFAKFKKPVISHF